MLLTLAQQQQPQLRQILIPIGAIIVVAVVGGLILMAVRRRMIGGRGDADFQRGFFDDLRDMLKRGEITQGEYDAAKANMAAKLAGKPPPPKPPAPPGAVRKPDGSWVAKPGVDLTGAPLPPGGGSPPAAGL
jgi:hypothetical protein